MVWGDCSILNYYWNSLSYEVRFLAITAIYPLISQASKIGQLPTSSQLRPKFSTIKTEPARALSRVVASWQWAKGRSRFQLEPLTIRISPTRVDTARSFSYCRLELAKIPTNRISFWPRSILQWQSMQCLLALAASNKLLQLFEGQFERVHKDFYLLHVAIKQ